MHGLLDIFIPSLIIIMVVVYCPACGKTILIKGVQPGEYPVEFKHCGHEIVVDVDEKKKK
jgi:DNA-directed RNA polymerase subunit RPC12/RpoP